MRRHREQSILELALRINTMTAIAMPNIEIADIRETKPLLLRERT